MLLVTLPLFFSCFLPNSLSTSSSVLSPLGFSFVSWSWKCLTLGWGTLCAHCWALALHDWRRCLFSPLVWMTVYVQPLESSAWHQCSYKIDSEIICKALFVIPGGEYAHGKFVWGAISGSPEVLTVVVLTHVQCSKLPSDDFEIICGSACLEGKIFCSQLKVGGRPEWSC